MTASIKGTISKIDEHATVILRRSWFRLLTTIVVLLIVDLLLIESEALPAQRTSSIQALQSIAILFAVTSALSIMLFSNYVHGIRKEYLEQVRRVRNILWDFYEKYNSSTDPAIKAVINDHIVPIAGKGLKDWLDIDQVNSWAEGIEQYFTPLQEKHKVVLYKYLLPIEDEINELAYLYIRSIVTTIHVKNIIGAFLLITFGMCILGLGYIVPNSTFWNSFILNGAIAVITLSILELLLLITHLTQEAREEDFANSTPENENDSD